MDVQSIFNGVKPVGIQYTKSNWALTSMNPAGIIIHLSNKGEVGLIQLLKSNGNLDWM